MQSLSLAFCEGVIRRSNPMPIHFMRRPCMRAMQNRLMSKAVFAAEHERYAISPVEKGRQYVQIFRRARSSSVRRKAGVQIHAGESTFNVFN